jgi:hypothetical protein
VVALQSQPQTGVYAKNLSSTEAVIRRMSRCVLLHPEGQFRGDSVGVNELQAAHTDCRMRPFSSRAMIKRRVRGGGSSILSSNGSFCRSCRAAFRPCRFLTCQFNPHSPDDAMSFRRDRAPYGFEQGEPWPLQRLPDGRGHHPSTNVPADIAAPA